MRRVIVAMTVVAAAATLVLGDAGRPAYGQTPDDQKQRAEEQRRRMQEQLNEQVMSRPFSVPSESEVSSYIEEQKQRGAVPPPYTGVYWRRGYTCHDLARYSRSEYLACRYYHSYYGRYYW